MQGALSFFRTAYDDFAGYRAVLNRLTGLLDSNEEARDLPGPAVEPTASGLGIRDLNVTLPDGRPLLSNLNLDLPAAPRCWSRGPPERARPPCCAAWPGCGRTSRGPSAPRSRVAPCSAPSSPTCPLGTLRTALAYPLPAAGLDDATAPGRLQAVLLGHLVGRLDEEADWSKDVVAGRAATAVVRPDPAGPAGPDLPRREHRGAGRGDGVRDVRPGPAVDPGLHHRQRRDTAAPWTRCTPTSSACSATAAGRPRPSSARSRGGRPVAVGEGAEQVAELGRVEDVERDVERGQVRHQVQQRVTAGLEHAGLLVDRASAGPRPA